MANKALDTKENVQAAAETAVAAVNAAAKPANKKDETPTDWEKVSSRTIEIGTGLLVGTLGYFVVTIPGVGTAAFVFGCGALAIGAGKIALTGYRMFKKNDGALVPAHA
jgi:hypothetical protein